MSVVAPILIRRRPLSDYGLDDRLDEVANRTAFTGRFAGDFHLRDAFTADKQWTEWTPTWTAVTTDPAAPAAITGAYKRYGQVVHVRIFVSADGSTTFGSGQWWLSLPFKAQAQQAAGVALALDSGSNYHTGVNYIQTLDPVTFSIHTEGGATGWDATTPHTWASGDSFRVELTYEAQRI